jgi:hypothetical protein
MFTYVHPDRAREWDEMSAEEQSAYRAEHEAWFAELGPGGAIVAGEELSWPRQAATITSRRGERLVTDGPFPESKEVLGGFIVLDVPTWDEALAIASRWPSLDGDGNVVHLAAGMPGADSVGG